MGAATQPRSLPVTTTCSFIHLWGRIGSVFVSFYPGMREEILKGKRAEYGTEILQALSAKLEGEYGRGFSDKSLHHMVRFAEVFPDEEIVSALRRQLGWTHFKTIVYLDDPLKSDFYAEMCRIERWSTRTLEKKIGGMLYERTALSRKPERVIRHELDKLRVNDQMTPDLVFKDPYILDFLGFNDLYGAVGVDHLSHVIIIVSDIPERFCQDLTRINIPVFYVKQSRG